jgi:hypothetical protein
MQVAMADDQPGRIGRCYRRAQLGQGGQPVSEPRGPRRVRTGRARPVGLVWEPGRTRGGADRRANACSASMNGPDGGAAKISLRA